MKAPIIETRASERDLVADINRRLLAKYQVLALSLIGGPGCGKTSLIESTIESLKPNVRVGVIECDISSHFDTDRMAQANDEVVQINAGPQGVIDASHIHGALQWLDLAKIDVLFIENVGTLMHQGPFDLGQDLTVAMFSVAAGHDKAEKHPDLVRAANIVLLNKTDLLSAVPFRLDKIRTDVKRLNPRAEFFELSALNGTGMEPWIASLKSRVKGTRDESTHWFG